MTNYNFTLSNNTLLLSLPALEQNGSANLSTPRSILDVDIAPTTGQVYFVVADNLTTRFTPGFAFQITGSAGYVGTYTVSPTGSSTAVLGGKIVTRIPVVEPIAGLNVPVAYVNGSTQTFFVSYTTAEAFVPTSTITLASNTDVGSNGTYTVVSSTLSASHGVLAVNPGTNTWIVSGDATKDYVQGQQLIISGATSGNGNYTITSVITNGTTTNIVVSETVPGTSTTDGTATMYPPIVAIDVLEDIPNTITTSGSISTTASTPVAYSLSTAPVLVSPLAGGLVDIRFTISGDHVSTFTPYVGSSNYVLIKGNNVLSFNRVPVTAVSLDTGATNTWVTVRYSSATTPAISATGTLVIPALSAPYGFVQYTVPTAATSLRLVGQGSIFYNNDVTWGQALQNNLINITEHFAADTAPTSPMIGQMWFDTASTTQLKLQDSNNVWQGVVATQIPVQSWLDINEQNVYDANLINRTGTTTGLTFQSGSLGGLTFNSSGGATFGATSTGDITFTSGSTGDITFNSTGGVVLSDSGNITFTNTSDGGLMFATGSTGSIQMASSGDILFSATGDLVFNNSSDGGILFDTLSTGGVTLAGPGGVLLSGAGSLTFGAASTGGIALNGTGGISITGTGDISLSNAGSNITLTGGDIQLTSDSSIIFSGTGTIDMNSNRIVNLGLPSAGTDGANKAYVDGLSSGIIWLSPVLDPTLYDDTLTTPPIANGTTPTTVAQLSVAYHKTYIVPTGATGDWVGLEGRAVQYVYDDPTSTWKWVDILGRAVAINDRFIVFGMPDQGDDLSIAGNLAQGGLSGQTGKIATVTGVAPFTYTFATPVEPYAVSVTGISPGSPVGSATSVHSAYLGYSFTFRGSWGAGTYGAGYQWIQFNGPQALVDGGGLRYVGNILNVGQGTGIVINANDVALDLTYMGNNYLKLDGTNTAVNVTTTGQFTSTVATGTPPLVVSSTTKVSNLNVSFLNGNTFEAPGSIGSTTPNAGAFTTLSASGQITSTVATGTAPFVVTSTTNVLNLNASLLNGNTFEIPGAIGSTTPNTAAFTTVTAGTWNGSVISGQYGGTGVNNSGKTITLGGSLTTTGAFTLNLTTTANTAVTLPTSGTLIGTSDVGTVTNLMLANSTISGIALGGTLNTLTIGTGLSGTSYNGSANVTIAVDSSVVTLTGNQTLTNKTLTAPRLSSPVDKVTIDATVLTGTVNVDLMTSTNIYYTSNTASAWDFNFRGNGTTTLNDFLAVGESVSCTILVTQGATPYASANYTVDGVAAMIKVRNNAGTGSSIDQYRFQIIKTAANTFQLLLETNTYI